MKKRVRTSLAALAVLSLLSSHFQPLLAAQKDRHSHQNSDARREAPGHGRDVLQLSPISLESLLDSPELAAPEVREFLGSQDDKTLQRMAAAVSLLPADYKQAAERDPSRRLEAISHLRDAVQGAPSGAGFQEVVAGNIAR